MLLLLVHIFTLPCKTTILNEMFWYTLSFTFSFLELHGNYAQKFRHYLILNFSQKADSIAF